MSKNRRKRNNTQKSQQSLLDQHRRQEQHRKLERFENYFPRIQEGLLDLQENWNVLVSWMIDELGLAQDEFEPVHDSINMISDLIEEFNSTPQTKKKKKKQHLQKIGEVNKKCERFKVSFEDVGEI